MLKLLNQKISLPSDRKLFGFGALLGVTMLSIALASVPRKGMVTDDTAMYQKLSEIHVAKEASPNFDSDIARLSALEPRYQERLPLAKQQRIAGPMNRISKKPYRYSSAQR